MSGGPYGRGKAPERVGLKHPSIAPYGGFTCADGRDIVISIQNEREWADFCRTVLRRPELLQDARCQGNAARVEHRDFVDGVVSEVFGAWSSGAVVDRLTEAQTAFGQVNSVYDLIQHPQPQVARRHRDVVPGLLEAHDLGAVTLNLGANQDELADILRDVQCRGVAAQEVVRGGDGADAVEQAAGEAGVEELDDRVAADEIADPHVRDQQDRAAMAKSVLTNV